MGVKSYENFVTSRIDDTLLEIKMFNILPRRTRRKVFRFSGHFHDPKNEEQTKYHEEHHFDSTTLRIFHN